MKINIIKHPLITSFIVAIIFSIQVNAQETTVKDYKIGFKFTTIKNFDNTRLLEVEFIGKNKKDRKDKIPVFDAEINFFNILKDEEILLGTQKTSTEGIAQITLPANQKYLTDKNGYINLTARFDGSDAINQNEEEIIIKDLHLKLDLEEIDSIKTVLVKAFVLDSLNVEIPVEEVDFIISIKGMLSKMKINEGTIENGEAEFEITKPIPGDVDKNYTVYALIQDSDEFGNVNQKKTINWGTGIKMPLEKENKLWSAAAPLWMYIVLTILLVGVWANFTYTIYNLYKIKKQAKKIELKPKNP